MQSNALIFATRLADESLGLDNGFLVGVFLDRLFLVGLFLFGRGFGRGLSLLLGLRLGLLLLHIPRLPLLPPRRLEAN